MLEVLEFIFRSFWTWLGTVILVGTIAEGLGGFIRITVKKRKEQS
jgi:hypothetical protein